MPPSSYYIRVAVPVPIFCLYDYRASSPIAPGARVLVTLGPRKLVGIVTESDITPHIAANKIKAIEKCLDPTPILDPHLLELCQWSSRYYHRPLGDVLATCLPKNLRANQPARRQTTRSWQLCKADAEAEISPRASTQRALYRAISQHNHYLHSDLRQQWPHCSQPLNKLAERGLIQAIETPNTLLEGNATQPPLPLTPAQAQALKKLRDQTGFAPTLIEGITGSGKTEVYLQRMADIVQQGRQILFLAPEIGLTPQLIERVRSRFRAQIGILHSARSDGERANDWLAAQQGQADIIIGTRSAIFTPMPRLGLIVFDEEHDSSYKQQDGFRYHARDVGLRRAQMLDIPIILGSATPALETLYNAQKNRYYYLRLTERAHGHPPPKINTIDVRSRPLEGGLSAPLLQRIRPHLEAGNQVLIFINRRGYAPVLMCHDCGWIAHCPRCDAPMTLHLGGRRIDCHHCGAIQATPHQCGQCQSNKLIFVGSGTEQVAATLRARFPGIAMARFDRDTVARKGSLEKLLAGVASGKTQLLVGTQMLAKGHDFARLTMVGIVNVDGGLFSVDFRAPEHLAQMVTQVAGRAGRGQTPGEVWLQTHHPEHPQLVELLKNGYAGFAQKALEEREIIGLPPFGHLALLRVEAKHMEQALAFLTAVKDKLPKPKKAQYWGPVPAPMPKRAGRFRAHLMLASDKRQDLHPILNYWQRLLPKLPNASRIRWSLDVDPQSLA